MPLGQEFLRPLELYLGTPLGVDRAEGGLSCAPLVLIQSTT